MNTRRNFLKSVLGAAVAAPTLTSLQAGIAPSAVEFEEGGVRYGLNSQPLRAESPAQSALLRRVYQDSPFSTGLTLGGPLP